jgi:hypothetical protein
MSGPYKRHFACFSCRKAFKQPPVEDYLDLHGRGYVYKQLQWLRGNKKTHQLREKELGHRLSDLEVEYRNATHKCPECGSQMIDMGLDFKPPKQSDAKSWRTLEGMYRVGHAFHTCGCDGPGWIPKSTSDYRDYLAVAKRHYEEQLKQVQTSDTLSPEGKNEANEYWISRIEAVDREQKIVV